RAVNVLVCDEDELVGDTAPSLELTVGVPQASVAVAVPSAALISEACGLHANVSVVPPEVIVGGIRSLVHVTVLDAVAELPHASTAVNVRVCDLEQPVLFIIPSEELTVGAPHASVAVAVPRAAFISEATGLQPSDNTVPPAVIVG